MSRHFDHIDLRVTSLTAARPFYETLLPALGFTRSDSDEVWIQYEAADEGGMTSFFGVTEDPGHVANANRIAFWAESNEAECYYAVFFEDPCGNRLEVYHRTANGSEAGPDDALSQA